MATNLVTHIIMSKFSNIFKKAFSAKYLLMTNIGVSVSLSALGDVLEQNYEIMSEELDRMNFQRTRNLSISGLTVGFVCHYWYKYLDVFLPGYTLKIVLKKVIVDQCIASPLCISTFFGTLGCLEGKSRKEFLEEVKVKAIKLYAADWMIWPPAQFINFYLLPSQYRILFDNTVSLGFDVYSSRLKHMQSEKDA